MAKSSSSSAMKKAKTKAVMRGRSRAKGSIRAILADMVTKDKPLSAADRKLLAKIPPHKRPGFRAVTKKGVKYSDPRKWKTEKDVPVEIDVSRRVWVPDDWCQGIKKTQGGGTFTVYLPPTEERTLYNPCQLEKLLDRKIVPSDCFQGMLRFAEFVKSSWDDDKFLSKMLSSKEKKHLVDKSKFHFAIVSARRASSFQGAKDIAMVQQTLLGAGVTPTWYVDKESLGAYRALGLVAKAGGKLTPARNMALRDAESMKKVCVQCSDDLSSWEYRVGPQAKDRTMDEQNRVHKKATVFKISPVAAARFILAKMRSVGEEKKPKLGGAYVIGCCSRTWGGDEFSRHNFILGDFFVADRSKVRFDERLTLKEDYDFVCSHLFEHGSVFRCNRMTFNAKHYDNDGGAVSIRNTRKERENIEILMQKWPGIITPNPRRKNEVLLRWPKGKGKTAKEKMALAMTKKKVWQAAKAKKSAGQKAASTKKVTKKKATATKAKAVMPKPGPNVGKAKATKAKAVLTKPGPNVGKASPFAAALRRAASSAADAAAAASAAGAAAAAGASAAGAKQEPPCRRPATPTKPTPKPKPQKSKSTSKPKPKQQKSKSTSSSPPPPTPAPSLPVRVAQCLAKAKLKPTQRLVATAKEPSAPYIRRRVRLLSGRTIAGALTTRFQHSSGERCKYGVEDLNYDLDKGFLAAR